MKIFVYGTPKAWARPRPGRSGHWYSPTKSSLWHFAVTTMAKRMAPTSPFQGAVAVKLTFHMPPPKRLVKQAKPSGWWCVTRPDIDNLAKEIIDALMDCQWFKDDAQVVKLRAEKMYAYTQIGAEIEVEEVVC